MPTPVRSQTRCREESRHGTHECVRHESGDISCDKPLVVCTRDLTVAPQGDTPGKRGKRKGKTGKTGQPELTLFRKLKKETERSAPFSRVAQPSPQRLNTSRQRSPCGCFRPRWDAPWRQAAGRSWLEFGRRPEESIDPKSLKFAGGDEDPQNRKRGQSALPPFSVCEKG